MDSKYQIFRFWIHSLLQWWTYLKFWVLNLDFNLLSRICFDYLCHRVVSYAFSVFIFLDDHKNVLPKMDKRRHHLKLLSFLHWLFLYFLIFVRILLETTLDYWNWNPSYGLRFCTKKPWIWTQVYNSTRHKCILLFYFANSTYTRYL